MFSAAHSVSTLPEAPAESIPHLTSVSRELAPSVCLPFPSRLLPGQTTPQQCPNPFPFPSCRRALGPHPANPQSWHQKTVQGVSGVITDVYERPPTSHVTDRGGPLRTSFFALLCLPLGQLCLFPGRQWPQAMAGKGPNWPIHFYKICLWFSVNRKGL